MISSNDKILNAHQAALKLGLSKSTLAKMRLSGVGPVFSKLGRRVVYRVSDLDAWVNGNKFRSTSEYANEAHLADTDFSSKI
jgi:predicted DNA-binding transcriptional regulator AlpA